MNDPALLVREAAQAEKRGDWAAAANFYRQLAAVSPGCGYEPRLAQALIALKQHAEAVPLLEQALARSPDNTHLLNALSLCLGKQGRWQESITLARRALALRGDAVSLENLLIAAFQLGLRDVLDTYTDIANAQCPERWRARAITCLHYLKGNRNLSFAFAHMADTRQLSTGSVAGYDTDAAGRRWDGHSFDGVLRITADGGLGDQLLGSSMFRDVEALRQKTQVLCDPRLLPLFRRSFPGLEFLPRTREGQQVALSTLDPARDRRVNAIDLGQFYRRTPAHFPTAAGWVTADAARVEGIVARYRAQWPGTLKVGVSWSSARLFEGGVSKGFELARMDPLLSLPGCTFLNLQYGAPEDIATALATLRTGTLHLDAAIDATADIDALAAQISALDVVITTSNTTAHLAGALGIPAWVLLPATRPVLWYWGYSGSTTHWYPGMHLWRCPGEDTWDELINAVSRELMALVASRG